MNKKIILLLLAVNFCFAQKSLDYFIDKALQNSPQLREYNHLHDINQIQRKLNTAENSAFGVSLSADYLFAPYFNNNGDFVSTNPSPDAYGYDPGITNGGLYSAQINLERNIFNGRILNVLDQQAGILDKNYVYKLNLEKHNLKKQVTEQYLTAFHSLQLMLLRDKIIANLGDQLKITADMVQKGYVPSRDYLLLKIELGNQTINANNAKNTFHSDLLQLYALCGITDTTIAEITPAKLTMNHPVLPSNFIQKYNLDSLSLVNQQELFETKYSPQLKIFANAGLNAVELNRIEQRFGMSAGMSFSLAILDGNQRSLTRQQNIINRQSVAEYRRFAINNIQMQRVNLEKRIHALQENMNGLDNQISDYKKLLKISSNQLQKGNISMIDYLTLLGNFTNLREQRIEMETNYQHEINNFNYWNW